MYKANSKTPADGLGATLTSGPMWCLGAAHSLWNQETDSSNLLNGIAKTKPTGGHWCRKLSLSSFRIIHIQTSRQYIPRGLLTYRLPAA
ncbi:hypothetical protein G9A89_011619 [Geosiphon pyriformis]|nr:hypothetical protein G9A89_011619 [Geosiphon pyriformis]